MKKRNCAETIVTAVLACSLCGGMITAYAGTDSVAAERQPAGVYGTERSEVSTGAADVPYESPKPSGESWLNCIIQS